MKCDEAVKIIHESDGRAGLQAGLHVFFCRGCRETLSRLESVRHDLVEYTQLPLPRDFTDDIMLRVSEFSAAELREVNRVPIQGWIAVGLVLIVSMYALSLSASHIWLKGMMGGVLEIPLNIAMGVIITAYAALFIGTHLDEFTDRFGVRH